MKAGSLAPNALIATAHAQGIHEWSSLADLVEQVEAWPVNPSRSDRIVRRTTARQYVGRGLQLGLAAAWLAVTGVFILGMKAAGALEGDEA